jgi:hypothetical protein
MSLHRVIISLNIIRLVNQTQSRIIDGPEYASIDYPSEFPLQALQPRLIVGEQSQAILHVEYIPDEIVHETIDWPLKRGALEDRLR